MSNLLNRENKNYTIDLDSISYDLKTNIIDVVRTEDTNKITSYKAVLVPKMVVSFFMNTDVECVYTVPVYFDELGSISYAKNSLTDRVESTGLTSVDPIDIDAAKILERLDTAIEAYIKDMENQDKWDSTEAQINRAFKKAISEIKA